MITGVTAVAPSGDGGPVRFTVSTAASSQSSSTEQAASSSSLAIAKPESSSAGSSTQNQQQPSSQRGRESSGADSAATGAYLASLLAASITGRAPEGARPSKITPERLSMLISYLESAVASTAPSRSEEEHAVDVKS